VAVHAAIRAGDGLGLCALCAPLLPSSPLRWRAAVIVEAALARGRRVGLATLAVAHRSLPARVVVDRLGLGGGVEEEEETHAALAALVREAGGEGGGGDGKDGKGEKPAAPAWAARALEGARVGGELVFKA